MNRFKSHYNKKKYVRAWQFHLTSGDPGCRPKEQGARLMENHFDSRDFLKKDFGPFLSGRILFLVITILCILGSENKGVRSENEITASEFNQSYKGVIVAVGDSLTEGLGVDEENAYPALLEKKLQAEGSNYRVINAGVSSETSSGTLSRIKWVISSLRPDIIILETGANDGLRGIDTNLLRSNLDQIITIINKNDIKVILAGMKILPNMGPEYAESFANVYPETAEKHDIPIIPFFLQGVAADPRLNQEDMIHPNKEGYKIVVENVYLYVKGLIKETDT